MKPASLLISAVILSTASGVVASALTWWQMRASTEGVATAAGPVNGGGADKYTNLDKVIVMLRGRNGEAMPHYLAVDLVFKSSPEQAKMLQEQLPLLRSVALRSLAGIELDTARQLTVEQIASMVAKACADVYSRERQVRPFSDVMVSKLIIE